MNRRAGGAAKGALTIRPVEPPHTRIIGVAIFVVALIASGTPASAAAPWANVVLGVWLFISPWVLRYVDVTDGATNAWVFGVVTVLVALWAMSVRRTVQPPMGGVDRLDTR